MKIRKVSGSNSPTNAAPIELRSHHRIVPRAPGSPGAPVARRRRWCSNVAGDPLRRNRLLRKRVVGETARPSTDGGGCEGRLVPRRGLEPPTPWLRIRYSCRLSYRGRMGLYLSFGDGRGGRPSSSVLDRESISDPPASYWWPRRDSNPRWTVENRQCSAAALRDHWSRHVVSECDGTSSFLERQVPQPACNEITSSHV